MVTLVYIGYWYYILQPPLTISLLQEGLQFLLSPSGCAEPDWLLLLVSSAPGEADLRAGWRQELSLLETEAARGVKVRPGLLSSDDYNWSVLSPQSLARLPHLPPSSGQSQEQSRPGVPAPR